MNTDLEWDKWGRRDPYFAVITDPRYRADRLTEAARQEFFESGRWHAREMLACCRRFVDPEFAPVRVLDFGCGVGRITLALAAQVAQVVGVDISPAMLAEARRNAQAQGIGNIEWVGSDDSLSAVTGSFDLVHSCITFQHIEVPRGRRLFARLVELLSLGGIGAIQITYAKARFAADFGQPPAAQATTNRTGGPILGRLGLGARAETSDDPEMQMNPYNLSELAFILQTAGVSSFKAEFTDHGGELGVFLFFKKPAPRITKD